MKEILFPGTISFGSPQKISPLFLILSIISRLLKSEKSPFQENLLHGLNSSLRNL